MDSLGVSMGFDDSAIIGDLKQLNGSEAIGRSPLIQSKTRSLSDGGGTPVKLSPSPHILHASRRTSKDDSSLNEPTGFSTPQRPQYSLSGLALHLPPRQFTPPVSGSGAFAKPAPLSPQLDNSQIYASPTNILPRRSRGLDFSRAATSLHHSTLAESSPDSSPVMGGRAMNIPGRRVEFGTGPEHSSSSLWSIMGNQERMNLSNSLGSAHAIGSASSTSEEDDDLMDEDMDDNFITTPSVSKTTSVLTQAPPGAPFGSPAIGSLINFQQRQRHRRTLKQRPRPMGFNSGGSSISNSPPSNAAANARRESISWQANQLHISGVESEDNTRASSEADGLSSDGQKNVVRRPVTRRGNLLVSLMNLTYLSMELSSAHSERFYSQSPRLLHEYGPLSLKRVPRPKQSSSAKQRLLNRYVTVTPLSPDDLSRLLSPTSRHPRRLYRRQTRSL